MIAGDSNDLKLDNITNLSSSMHQHVSVITSLDPPAMLDPIISTLGCFYQTPVCLPPLDPDPDSNGSPSDHLIVVMRPVNTINNKSARTVREVKVRPLTNSGMAKIRAWMEKENWEQISNTKDVHEKALKLHSMVLDKLDQFCPEKLRKIANDDKPWFTQQLKKLDRRRRRCYRSQRSSQKYRDLQKQLEWNYLSLVGFSSQT